MKTNYQKMLDVVVENIQKTDHKPTLLLHVCCAPCSTYVLDYLAQYFDITLYFYNPNISPPSEYDFRLQEVEGLIKEMKLSAEVKILSSVYDQDDFLRIAKGKENLKEGDTRCYDCYSLRLEETAKKASSNNFDYFTTSLSISPRKNSTWLNEIGALLEEKHNTKYLYSDFKKKEGYKKSIQFAKQYNLYRQDYCGCAYSKMQREAEKDADK